MPIAPNVHMHAPVIAASAKHGHLKPHRPTGEPAPRRDMVISASAAWTRRLRAPDRGVSGLTRRLQRGAFVDPCARTCMPAEVFQDWPVRVGLMGRPTCKMRVEPWCGSRRHPRSPLTQLGWKAKAGRSSGTVGDGHSDEGRNRFRVGAGDMASAGSCGCCRVATNGESVACAHGALHAQPVNAGAADSSAGAKTTQRERRFRGLVWKRRMVRRVRRH